MMKSNPGPVTRLFSRWRAGDESAEAELLPQVYEELRLLASRYLRREHRGHTLQPTELVNEAFVRLLGSDVQVNDRTHFFALAARNMRRILVDHARRQRSDKKLGYQDRVTLMPEITPGGSQEVDVLVLNDLLERLAKVAPRPARVFELRYFGGLTIPQAAEVLEVSVSSAERAWKSSRIWLGRELASF